MVRNINSENEGTFVNASNRPKFIMPISKVSFFVNNFLDDLKPEGWSKELDVKDANCVGLSINLAVSILEEYGSHKYSRIEVFIGAEE